MKDAKDKVVECLRELAVDILNGDCEVIDVTWERKMIKDSVGGYHPGNVESFIFTVSWKECVSK